MELIDRRDGRRIHDDDEAIAALSTQAPFVGRTREVGTLEQHVAATLSGETRVVLASGEPGIGKTTLLLHVAEQVARQGGIVLRGGTSEAEGMPPYLPFLEALGHHIRSCELDLLRRQVGSNVVTLAHIFPELTSRLGDLSAEYPLPSDQARLRLFEAVAQFLAAISLSRPLILLLDDLQWADRGTLDLLCHVTRHQPAARILVLGAYRKGEGNDNAALQRAIVELSHQRVLALVTLDPLSADDMTQLAHNQLAMPVHPTLAQRLYVGSEGNPFFAEELLRGWLDGGSLACVNGEWMLGAPVDHIVPTSILSAIRQRLGPLPSDTVDALRVAAIIGRTFDLSLLARIRDEEEEGVERCLLEGVRACLVQLEGNTSYRFIHDTIRECLYAEVSGARRRRLHEAIGLALEGGAEHHSMRILAELAFHFARSGDRERGITYSLQAAEGMEQSYAWEDALIHYETVVDLLDPSDERRGDVLLLLGEATLLAGKEHEAAIVFETAHREFLHGNRAVSAARAMHGLGRARWREGALPAARIALEAAVELLADHRGPETAAVLIDLASLLNLALGLQAEGVVHGERALEIARASEDRGLEVAAGRIVGQLKARGNDWAGGIAILERALVLAKAVDNPVEAADICGALSNAYYVLFDVDRSRQITLMRIEYAQRCHDFYGLRHVYSWLAQLCVLQGEWSQAEQLIEESQAIVERLADDEPLADLHRVRGLLAYHRERYEEAEQWFREALTIVRPKGPQHIAWYLGLVGVAQLATGTPENAPAFMAELESTCASLPAGSAPTAPALTALLEMALATGDVGRARQRAGQLRVFEGQIYLFMVDPTLGSYEISCGNWAAAEGYLTRAESDARRARLQPLLLDILLRRAALETARAGQDSADRIKAVLNQALQLSIKLQLDDKTGAIESRLGELKAPESRGRSAPRPGGLSGREVEVLRLVVAGKTNRDIAQDLHLSEHTVANHLTGIFNKTGADNRAAAAAFAIRHGLA